MLLDLTKGLSNGLLKTISYRNAQHFVKMSTALEVLDYTKGCDLFIKQADNPSEYHQFLMIGAKIAIGGNASDEDAKQLLQINIPQETGKGIKMVTIAQIAAQV